MDTEDLHVMVGRIDANVKMLLQQRATDDERLTKVERKVWWASGAAAVLAVFASKYFPFLHLVH